MAPRGEALRHVLAMRARASHDCRRAGRLRCAASRRATRADCWRCARDSYCDDACVCTLQAHFIIDEMCMNGSIVETNKHNALAPIHLLEKATS